MWWAGYRHRCIPSTDGSTFKYTNLKPNSNPNPNPNPNPNSETEPEPELFGPNYEPEFGFVACLFST